MVIIMKKLGIISIALFLISLLVFGVWFFDEQALNGTFAMIVAIIFPIIGLFTAFKSKGALKIIGVFGNAFVLTFSVVLPALSTLFWNQP